MSNRGLRDITPLNVPSGAFTPFTPESQSGWISGNDGNWHWSTNTNAQPNVQIPITKGPGIPSNSGWVNGPSSRAGLGPDQNWYWTGPGTRPTVLPGSFVPPGTMPSTPYPATGLPHNWTPEPILPDSMLPPAIQRSNPILEPAQFIPTRYDYDIFKRAKKWDWIAKHGGLKSCCRIPELGAPLYDDPPWEVMPPNAVPIPGEMAGLPITSISGGGPFTGANTLLLSIQVPSGYDGVINRFVAATTGVTGHVDFSGDIVWRLEYGVRYAKTLGNVTNTFGSFTNSLLVPGVYSIKVLSGQTIQVFVSIPAGSPVAGGSVSAGVFGWFYPRR